MWHWVRWWCSTTILYMFCVGISESVDGAGRYKIEGSSNSKRLITVSEASPSGKKGKGKPKKTQLGSPMLPRKINWADRNAFTSCHMYFRNPDCFYFSFSTIHSFAEFVRFLCSDTLETQCYDCTVCAVFCGLLWWGYFYVL